MKTASFAMVPLILAMSNPAPVADKPRPAVRTAPATAQPRPAAMQQAGELTLKTYKVHFADLQQLTEVIPLMMPDADDLSLQTVDKNLVVRGTPEQHRVVQQMLRELDAPPKNIQVNVKFGTSGGSYNKEIGIRPKGPIVINQDGVHGSLQGQLRNQSTTLNENTTQMLVAMDGRSASLRVGETVPNIVWLTEYGHRHGYVRNIEIEWRDVGSFLAVEPSIIGPGLIRIRLIPELSGRLKNGDRHRIQFTHLATEVTVRDGQTISIGGFSKDNNFSSKFLIGRGSSGESSVTDITLTPRILP
jgi:type II secretory pathway component GspD/PulD (secretin)